MSSSSHDKKCHEIHLYSHWVEQPLYRVSDSTKFPCKYGQKSICGGKTAHSKHGLVDLVSKVTQPAATRPMAAFSRSASFSGACLGSVSRSLPCLLPLSAWITHLQHRLFKRQCSSEPLATSRWQRNTSVSRVIICLHFLSRCWMQHCDWSNV